MHRGHHRHPVLRVRTRRPELWRRLPRKREELRESRTRVPRELGAEASNGVAC
ncbi:hypothetical protein ACFPRL_07955 [Pseudoclavibacter helvolus]